MKLALKERKDKNLSRVSSRFYDIGDILGGHHATPGDSINLYRDALEDIAYATSSLEKSQAYLEEGRLLVLRLIGNVLTYYRQQTLNFSKHPASSEASPFKARLRESMTS